MPPNREGVPSYVFGTIHAPQEEVLPHLPDNIIEALTLSDVFVGEISVTDWFNNHGILPSGMTAALKRWPEPPFPSPSMLSLMMNADKLELDDKLWCIAASDKKSTLGLETFAQNQKTWEEYDKISRAVNEYYRNDPSSTNEPNEAEALPLQIQLYLNGKQPTSKEEFLQMGGKTHFMKTKNLEIMLHEMPVTILRNKKMTAEMIKLMKNNKEKGYFFAVGVAHVIYSSMKNQNILDHLKAGGFHLERILPGEILTGGSVSYSN